MASFLDKQTRVLDIQLTPFGKNQLAKGKFEPYEYAFFDDDILYDSRYAGFDEVQNDIQDRIIKNTPSLEAQVVFSGRETEVKRNNEFIRMGEFDPEKGFKRLGAREVQATPEKHYSLSAPLGTIRLDATSAPAWSVDVLRGEISSSNANYSGDHQNIKTPQLGITPVEYQYYVEVGKPPEDFESSLVDDPSIPEDETNIESFTRKFSDGSYLKIFKDFLLLEITEENTDSELENFDIEVFEVGSFTDPFTNIAREELIPLYFQRQKPDVVNDILLDEDEQNLELPDLDPSYVEYYFDVFVDSEIDPDVLCKYLPINKPNGVFGQRQFECKDKVKSSLRDALYDSDVTEEDLEGTC